jgi:hypothetical protein
MKTMEYPLTAVTISESQWNSLMAPVIKTVLQKTGFAATFPRDVFFGPVKYQGFGCRHPFYHQEALHILTFVNEIYSKTQTGQLLLVSLEELIWELGLLTLCTISRMAHMNLALPTHGLGLCGNLCITTTSG